MTTEEVDYARKLAFAKTKCSIVPADAGLGHSIECLCGGTELVYLLPDESGVRVKCGGGHFSIISDALHTVVSPRQCEEVGCPGYVALNPTAGGDEWAQAVWPPLRQILDQEETPDEAMLAFQDYRHCRLTGHTPEALESAYKALLAAGAVEVTP